jgi:hypothetical protein
MEGFMSKNPQLAVPAGPQVPDNATFIGAWDRDCGVDIFYEALYLTRGNEQDSLESLPDFSENTTCLKSLPRQGLSERAAATRLLDDYVRARFHYDFPVPPYVPGLLTSQELANIVGAVTKEYARNSAAAEAEELRHPTPIIEMARELNLGPRPAGHNTTAWMAWCPRTDHRLTLSVKDNEFGCGYCCRKGGPAELRAFYEFRVGRLGTR